MNPPTKSALDSAVVGTPSFYHQPGGAVESAVTPVEHEVDWSQILNEPNATAVAAAQVDDGAPFGQGRISANRASSSKSFAVRLAPRRQSVESAANPVPTGLATPIVSADAHATTAGARLPVAPDDDGAHAPDTTATIFDAQVRYSNVPMAHCAPNLRTNVGYASPTAAVAAEVPSEQEVPRELPRTAVAPVQIAGGAVEACDRRLELSPVACDQLSATTERSGSDVASNSSGAPPPVEVSPAVVFKSSSSKLHKRFLEATARSSFASRRYGRSLDAAHAAPVVAEPRVVSLIPEEDVEVGTVKLVPNSDRTPLPQLHQRFKTIEAENCSSSDQEPKSRQRRYKKFGRHSPRRDPQRHDEERSRHQRRSSLHAQSGGRYSDDDNANVNDNAPYTRGRLQERPKSRGSTHSVYDERSQNANYWTSSARGDDRMVRSLSRMSDFANDYDGGADNQRRYCRPKSAQPELWDSQNSSDDEEEEEGVVLRTRSLRAKRTDYLDPRIGALFQIPAWRQYLNEHWRQFGFFPSYEQLQYYSIAQQKQQRTTMANSQPTSTDGLSAASGSGSCRASQLSGKTADDRFLAVLNCKIDFQEPYLYSRPHCVARFGVGGRLVVLSGGGERRSGKAPSSVVEVRNVRSMIGDLKLLSDGKTMETFPGPLDACQTAKAGVLQYCAKRLEQLQRTSEHRDQQSLVLVLQFFALMVRQNGMVDGKDLADLLLRPCQSGDVAAYDEDDDRTTTAKKEPELVATDSDGDFVIPLRVEANGGRTVSTKATQTVDMAEREFTRLLLRGYKKEALDWAIKSRLWGHALFLAMKTDRHTHMTVMTRFANSVPIDSPLQTLYQMLSGGVPYASTRLSDKSHVEWRTHLAMVLANLTTHDDHVLQRELYGVLTMGNTLMNVGQTFGAQFCYICCQLLAGWNIFDNVRGQSPLVTLVGLDGATAEWSKELPSVFNYVLTELLEYAMALQWLYSKNCCFWIMPLQKYKMRYAILLSEFGFVEEAFAYCHVLTKAISYEVALNGRIEDSRFMANLYEFAWRHHRLCQDAGESFADANGAAVVPDWLEQLRAMCATAPERTASAECGNDRSGSIDAEEVRAATVSTTRRKSSNSFVEQILIKSEDVSSEKSVEAQEKTATTIEQTAAAADVVEQFSVTTASYRRQSGDQDGTVLFEGAQRSNDYGDATAAWSRAAESQWSEASHAPTRCETERRRFDHGDGGSPADGDKPKREVDEQQRERGNRQSWIGKTMGGFIQKLIAKGPNEMILPDDSKKTIVWDKERKRWVDMSSPLEEEAEDVAPPPAVTPASQPAMVTSAGGNLQNRRYVNVVNSSGDQQAPPQPFSGAVPPPELNYSAPRSQSYWMPTVDPNVAASAVSPFTDYTQQLTDAASEATAAPESHSAGAVPFVDPSMYSR